MSLRATAWQPHVDKHACGCHVAIAPRNDIIKLQSATK